MPFAVVFGQTNKVPNSTQISYATPATYNCILKGPCTILHPVIELTEAAGFNPAGINYCRITAFDKYYFVNKWEYVDRRWRAYCDVDAMASYKTTIGSSTQYILRSASRVEANVVDTMYPAKIGAEYQQQTNGAWINDWVFNPSAAVGTCIVGMVNNDTNQAAGTTYFVMNGSQISQLKQVMLSSIENWDDITTFTGDIAKAFMDPMQYMVSCMWFPFSIAASGSDIPVKFGFWDSGVSAKYLDVFTRQVSKIITRPERNTPSQYKWMYMEPFAEYYLLAYPFGNIPISGNDIGPEGIQCDLMIDYITGIGTLEIKAAGTNVAHAQVLWTGTAQIGIPLQLSQISTDYFNAASGILSGLSGMIGGLIAGGGAISAISGANIGSSVTSMTPRVSQMGSTGGFSNAVLGASPYFNAIYRDPVEADPTHNGMPVCKNLRIDTLSGYIKCDHVKISASGMTEEEQELITNYMQTGFYYE